MEEAGGSNPPEPIPLRRFFGAYETLTATDLSASGGGRGESHRRARSADLGTLWRVHPGPGPAVSRPRWGEVSTVSGVDTEALTRVLDGIDADEPPGLEMAEQLAEGHELTVADAQAAVCDAINKRVLVEEGTGSAGSGSPTDAQMDRIVRTKPPPRAPDGSKTTTRTGEIGAEPRDIPESWRNVDFAATTGNTYPPALLDREQWMGRLEGTKLPFSPWADRDHPDAEDDKDARYKWGLEENHVNGDTVAKAEIDPKLDGRMFVQTDADPFVLVDGDDVRNPETDDVHPTFRARQVPPRRCCVSLTHHPRAFYIR